MAAFNKRTIIAGMFGNVLQWYDFAVFGYFAPAISTQFFPSDDPIAGLLKTYGIFAMGYFAQPIGGVLFGNFGDRIGRKRALQISIVSMGIPTTLMCLLPTHAQIGIWAPLLLVLLRFAQGVAAGGEATGSICYLVEVSPPGRRALYSSYIQCGVIGGLLIGSGLAALFHITLSGAEIAQWGWRLPFLGGLVLCFLGFTLRRGLLETPAFEEILDRGATVPHPVLHAIRRMPQRIIQVAVMLIMLCVALNILFLWMPTYLTRLIHPPVTHALLINTLAMLLLIATIPLAGILSDRLGHKPVLVAAAILIAILAYPLLAWIDTGALVAVVIGQVIFAILIGFVLGPIGVAMSAQFPVELRYSGMAAAYNISVAVFSGTAPLVATWLIKETGNLTSPAWYVAAAAVVSGIATLSLKGRFEKTDNP